MSLTDITEHPTAEGKLYLCAVKDLHTNKIVGYSVDSRMKSSLAVAALRDAVALRQPRAPSCTPTGAVRVDSTGRRNTSTVEVFRDGDRRLEQEDE